MIGKGMDPAFRPLIKRPNMERRSPFTEPLESRLAPSSPSLSSSSSTTSSSSSTASKLLARDIAGFREALNYAREAMKNQPEVELGTGAEGAGVGVIVNPGINVPQGSAAAGRPNRPVRRFVQPGMPMDSPATMPRSGITLMAIAEI